jgi:transcriptional regulator with XRE-family HTH domain
MASEFLEPFYTADAMTGRPPTKDAPPFGQRLSAARRGKGLSQRQLAERLGVTEEAVQRDEAGGYARAGLDRLARVAAALGVRLRLTGHLASDDAPTGAPLTR